MIEFIRLQTEIIKIPLGIHREIIQNIQIKSQSINEDFISSSQRIEERIFREFFENLQRIFRGFTGNELKFLRFLNKFMAKSRTLRKFEEILRTRRNGEVHRALANKS